MNKTISEKKAFLEEIIPLVADPSKKDEMQQKHYAFLLKDTNGGKLYKYRTFDSHGYALNSLINGTLHCSRPDTRKRNRMHTQDQNHRQTMRLFAAVRLESPVLDSLSQVRAELKRAGASGSFPSPENYHITLAFIGEYPDARKVKNALNDVRFPAFRIELSGLGTFGDTLWAGLRREPQMENLALTVRRALAAAGIPSDPKPFRAHITLARRFSLETVDPRRIEVREAGMTVHSFSLLRSQFGERGMIYTELARIEAERNTI